MAGQSFYTTPTWRRLRKLIVKKYHGCCSVCGVSNAREVHHVKPRKDYPELQYDMNNLVLLCASCHNATHDRINGDIKELSVTDADGFSSEEWR